MKRIYLIRHGRQNSTLCNVDVPLAEEGKKQAELLGPRLAGYGIQKIYHSTLIRARETAQILNEFLQIPIQELPFIQEVDFGVFTAKP
ncbi:phosphoglycerate mutase family protein [Clostridium sp. CAG:167]|nr:phosphoglycerate mutase family protein [Clostridium sp. CAG:167]